jgi:hypothetical protein
MTAVIAVLGTNPLTARSLDPPPGCVTLQKGHSTWLHDPAKLGQALLLVAALACKCGGRMTLQKSAFKWLLEAANWHLNPVAAIRADVALSGGRAIKSGPSHVLGHYPVATTRYPMAATQRPMSTTSKP